MKTIILAGGYGSRISSLKNKIPKPMIKIGNKPILLHVMDTFIKYGHKDFYIALGYKGNVIKKYFLSKKFKNCLIKINSKIKNLPKNNKIELKITLCDTGIKTMTGGRVKKILRKINKNEKVFLTYGDGVGNINLNKLLYFHNKHKKKVTITAVKPPARFGELIIKKNKVLSFKEKPQLQKGWINGGYFIIDKDIERYIKSNKTVFEKEPLEKLVKQKQLMSFIHNNFWQCMDNLRDKISLEKFVKLKYLPWLA